MIQDFISVIRPLTITDTILTDCNVAESDYSEYAGGTTYADGDRVIVIADHVVYESLQGANTGNTPSTSPTWWIAVSATNAWKAFDLYNNTRTVTDGGETPSIIYEFTPGIAITGIGVLDIINATSLEILVDDPVYNEVYSVTVDVSALPATSGWWEWFFGTRSAPTQYVVTDIPSYPEAVITISLYGTDALAVGKIIIGQQYDFGVGVNYGARIGIQDYSRKETNTFGDVELVQRAYAKKASVEVKIARNEIDKLQLFFATIRAIPCLWVLSEQFEALEIFGIYKNFEILISYYNYSDCTIEIEGLT